MRSWKARDIEIARALVERRRRHVTDAGLFGRILVAAAFHREIHRDQAATAGSRTSQASMPPGLTTRSIVVAAAGDEHASAAAIATPRTRETRSKCRHERFSSDRATSFTRKPVTERRLSSHFRAASRT